MKFFTRIAVLFYVTIVLLLGIFIVWFAINPELVGFIGSLGFVKAYFPNLAASLLISKVLIMDFFNVFFADQMLRVGSAIFALIMLALNCVFYLMFSVNVHRDKIIAFDNPSGRVSVSLFALEDLLRRMLAKTSEIKEAKPSIAASRKGLRIKIRLTLCSEVNIPEVTSNVQTMVRKKMQDTIGIDEDVDVSIYIGKIIPDKAKKEETKEVDSEESLETNIPFQGYRA